MVAKEKTKPAAPASVFIYAWSTDDGTLVAFGVDTDKVTAKKLADRSRLKWEKNEDNNGVECTSIRGFEIPVSKLVSGK